MSKLNARNERTKRKYLVYLKDAEGLNEASIDAVTKALHRFETYTGHKDFSAFHFEQARAFKRHLQEQVSLATGEVLSKATLHSTLRALRKFFHWLAGQPGYKSRISYQDVEYFNLPAKDVRVATARRQRPVPTIEQILHVLRTMPATSDIELRDRAVVAFVLLTGARDRAVTSFKLKHVDLPNGTVEQDAREVRTKFSKTFATVFFPVDSIARQVFEEWVRFLMETKLWGSDDPLFPASKVQVGKSRKFEVVGLARDHWTTSAPVRKIFRSAFVAAGLPYFNPHSVRHTLSSLGATLCKTPEEYKAWSQNLGHEQVLTTFRSYGQVSQGRQAEILRALGRQALGSGGSDAAGIVEQVRRLVGTAA